MDQLGKAVVTAMQRSPSSTPAAPETVEAGPPALVDQHTDFDLPKLFSSFAIIGKPRSIVRGLADDERRALDRRCAELHAGISPFPPGEADAVRSALSAMLSGFRSMRHEGDEARATVSIMTRVLAEFPRWAIQRACLMVARGEAGLDRRWAPNDAEMHAITAKIIEPYRDTLTRVRALLVAPVESPAARQDRDRRPTLAELKAKHGENWGLQPRQPRDEAAELGRARRSYERSCEQAVRSWGDEPAQSVAGIPISRHLAETIGRK